MGVPYTEDDLRSAQLGELALLTVVKGFGEFLKRHKFETTISRCEGILGGAKKVVNVENCPRTDWMASRVIADTSSFDDDVGAALSADDRTFQIGRPTRIGPGSSEEQIRNRAPLNRSPDFGSRWKG